MFLDELKKALSDKVGSVIRTSELSNPKSICVALDYTPKRGDDTRFVNSVIFNFDDNGKLINMHLGQWDVCSDTVN